MDRIWSRLARAEGLAQLLAEPPPAARQTAGTWEFLAFNKRMRFLKYSPGQYFKGKFCQVCYVAFSLIICNSAL